MKVVLLAAGLSSRMKGGNKLIRPIGATCLFEIAIENALSYSSEVYAVTGNDRDRIGEIAGKHGVSTIFNPAYERGQETSIRAAVEALAGPLIILPSDLPLINREDYLLCDSALQGHLACRPIFEGRPGHPVGLAEDFLALYRKAEDTRLRDLMKSVDANFYTTERMEAVYDIDTEEVFKNFATAREQ